MSKSGNKTILGLAFVVICMAVLFFAAVNVSDSSQELKVGGQNIEVQIADDDEERSIGLGESEKLSEKQGMLFIFEETARHGIWMKDVDFPIDVIWLNENKKIVYIEPEMRPDSYPSVFHPDEPAKYVIELSAGFVEKYNVKDGDVVEW